ncbi:uncharacterized protein RBU57_003317 [Macrochelys suwanniensis]
MAGMPMNSSQRNPLLKHATLYLDAQFLPTGIILLTKTRYSMGSSRTGFPCTFYQCPLSLELERLPFTGNRILLMMSSSYFPKALQCSFQIIDGGMKTECFQIKYAYRETKDVPEEPGRPRSVAAHELD